MSYLKENHEIKMKIMNIMRHLNLMKSSIILNAGVDNLGLGPVLVRSSRSKMYKLGPTGPDRLPILVSDRTETD